MTGPRVQALNAVCSDAGDTCSPVRTVADHGRDRNQLPGSNGHQRRSAAAVEGARAEPGADGCRLRRILLDLCRIANSLAASCWIGSASSTYFLSIARGRSVQLRRDLL